VTCPSREIDFVCCHIFPFSFAFCSWVRSLFSIEEKNKLQLHSLFACFIRNLGTAMVPILFVSALSVSEESFVVFLSKVK